MQVEEMDERSYESVAVAMAREGKEREREGGKGKMNGGVLRPAGKER